MVKKKSAKTGYYHGSSFLFFFFFFVLFKKKKTLGLPIHAGLPSCIIEAVAYIQDHRSSVTVRSPVITKGIFPGGVLASILFLENITSTPDDKGEDKHDDPSHLCPRSSSNIGKVERKAENESPTNLSQPVKHIVERASTRVEPDKINVLKLVGVEPIRGEEHRKEKYYIRISPKGLPEADDLRLPCWVLH